MKHLEICIRKYASLVKMSIFNHEGFRKYSANTIWMFVGHFFSLLTSFIVGAWVARYLGPQEYGQLNYIIIFVGLFGFISQLGIYDVFSRDLVQYPQQRDVFLGTGFVLLLGGGLIAFLSTVLSVFLFEARPIVQSLIVLYAVTHLFSPLHVIGIFFQSTVQVKKNVFAGVCGSICASLCKIAIIFSNLGLGWLILAFMTDAVITLLISVYNYKHAGFKFGSWVFDSETARYLLKQSWVVMCASGLFFLFTRVDQVIIKNMLGVSEIGIYNAGIKLVEIWYVVPTLLIAALLPAVLNAKKTDHVIYINRIKKLLVALVGVAIFIATILTIFAQSIVLFMFGSEYAGATSVVQTYSWSLVGFFAVTVCSRYFLVEKKLHYLVVIYFFLVSVNIIFNLTFVPLFGIVGSAVSSVFSYVLVGILSFLFYKNKLAY